MMSKRAIRWRIALASLASSFVFLTLLAVEIRAESDGKKPLNPDGLARERYLKRADEQGHVPMDGLIRAKEHIDRMRSQIRDGGIWDWQWLGPGNVGGRVRTILTHPIVPGRMWIGSVAGGIWRTDNDGQSWTPVDDFMVNLAVTSMVIDPTNPSTLYAATGEGFYNGDALPGAGIFKSTDGGVTWGQLASTNDPNFRYVNRLAHHPASSGALFAATRSGGVQKTTDGGSTWSLALSIDDAADVKIDSGNPNRVLVGTWGYAPFFEFGEVHYSTNGGTSWSNETSGAPNKLPASGGRCEVAFAGNGFMYVSMDQNGGQVWRSTDQGATWTLRSSGVNYLGGQGWYDNTIWVDPFDPNFVIVGGIDLWRSTNGGSTFTQISTWPQYHTGLSAHADQHTVIPHPSYNGTTNRRVFVGNDGGIQTANNIATVSLTSGWTNLANNLGITQFYGGATSPDGSRMIGGSQDNDNLRYTTAGGTTWYQAETGDGGYCAIDFTNPMILYGEYIHLQIEKSTNGGDSYFAATNGLQDAGSGNSLFIAPFVMDPSNASTLVAGGRSIWRTVNGAGLWTAIRGPQVGTPFGSALAIPLQSSSTIWVGYNNGLISKTTDGGSNWTNVDGGVPNRFVTDIAISPSDPNHVIVTLSGYNPDNVWLTTDGGLSWENRSGAPPHDLPALHVSTVVYHPSASNWIYIGTDLGVFASEDLGLTWSATPRYPNNEGPVNVEVDDLFWYGGQYLVAATHGRGMFVSRPLSVVFVDVSYSGPEDGSQTKPYNTIHEGIAAAGHGTILVVRTGIYREAPLSLTKRGWVMANHGTVRIQ
jgi:photosystem II stability/assembly factor-like uncharacterized protein